MSQKKTLIKATLGAGITVSVVVVLTSLALIFMLLAVLLSIPLSRIALEHSLKDISNESNSTPAYVMYGNLHIENETLDISNIYQEQRGIRAVKEIFCISGDKAYFVHTCTGAWTIASIDLRSKEIQDHCVFSDTREAYRSEHYGEYSERMGYYYDGQIVLSDFSSVFVYDMGTKETNRYEYDEYEFPQRTIYGECADDTLKLHIMDWEQIFTLEDMAAQSEGIAKIYALKDKKDWRKCSYLKGFLSYNTVEVIGGRIYFIGSVSNWQGEPYAIILEYERSRDTWMYVTKCFVGSDIQRCCYVIPVV